MLLAQKKLSRHSAVLLGYEAVQQFGNLNAVLTSAHDLFPKGTVVLQGMKSFSHYSIDHAIIDAASVLNASNSILRDMFMEVLLGREDLLKPVEDVYKRQLHHLPIIKTIIPYFYFVLLDLAVEEYY